MNSSLFNPSLFASRFALGLGAAALLSLGGLRPAAAQTVGNAGFEAPAVGSGSYGAFAYNPGGTAWTFSSGSGVSGNGSGFTTGNPSAPEGVQVGFVQINGTISQTIDGFSEGTYTFDFLSAQRATGDGNPGPDAQNLQVLVDNAPLFGLNGLTPVGTSYQLYTTNPIALSAGTHTLTFQGLNTAGQGAGNNGDNTAFIDSVGINKVAPVPEASSVISLGMLLALGLGGVAVARKKAVKA